MDNEKVAEKIVEEFIDVNSSFRLYNMEKKFEHHIKEYLKYLVRKHLE